MMVTMKYRGKWGSTEFPRGCGAQIEGVPHIFQYRTATQIWEKLRAIIARWVQLKRAAPQILPYILNIIDNEKKVANAHPLHLKPTLNNPYNAHPILVWIQVHIYLLSYYWLDIQNLYLK